MPTKPKTAVLQVRIEPDELERFQEFCERTKRTSASEVVRQWVYEAIGGPPRASEPPEAPKYSHPVYKQPDGRPLNRKQRRAMGRFMGKQGK